MVFGYSWKRPQSNISLFFILFCSCQSCCQKIIITICGVVVIFHVCCCCSLMLARASAAESLLRVYTRIIERLASLSIQCMMLRQEPKRLLEGELLRISIQWLTQVFCGVIKTFLQLCSTFLFLSWRFTHSSCMQLWIGLHCILAKSFGVLPLTWKDFALLFLGFSIHCALIAL